MTNPNKKLIFKQTGKFTKWLDKLKNRVAKDEILSRISAAEDDGNFGNWKSLGAGVYEMKIYIGQGYRLYYAQEGDKIYWLLCGGDKSTQEQDIKTAKAMWQLLKK